MTAPIRHCEERSDEAIQCRPSLDCFPRIKSGVAMTGERD